MLSLSTQRGFGAKGLAYLAIHEDGSYKCSFGKFMKPEELDALVKAMDGQPGDLLFFAADKNKLYSMFLEISVSRSQDS